jgi:hypothetical protein
MKAVLSRSRTLTIGALMVVLTGCGGGGLGSSDSSSSSSGASGSNASAAGLWTGTDSASGLSLTGIIDAAGVADFIRSDGLQYSGTVEVSGSTLDIALNVNTQYLSDFSDGSTSGVGTLNASFVAGSTLSGKLSFTTAANSVPLTSTWSLTFSNEYNTASSPAIISGSYTDTSDSAGDPFKGDAVSISSLGALTAQSATSGCVMNGTVTTPSTNFDAYAFTYTLASCAGDYVALNGLSFSGVGLKDASVSPAQVEFGVRGQTANGVSFGIASALTLN